PSPPSSSSSHRPFPPALAPSPTSSSSSYPPRPTRRSKPRPPATSSKLTRNPRREMQGSMRYDLEGQVAIVTGGGQGIGQVIARRLAAEGMAVVVAARTHAKLAETVDQIAAAGGRALAVPTDITHADQVRALVDRTVDAYGRLDLLVNNAVEAGDPAPVSRM